LAGIEQGSFIGACINQDFRQSNFFRQSNLLKGHGLKPYGLLAGSNGFTSIHTLNIKFFGQQTNRSSPGNNAFRFARKYRRRL
jgi:hypothetical protein